MAQESNVMDGRERLVGAAVELFSEKGYAAVGIREIAAKAECSLSLIKHHFGSKVGLFEYVIMADMSTVGSELAAITTCGDDPRERVEQLVRAMVDVFEQHRTGLQIVVKELAQKDSLFAERLTRLIRQIVAQVVRMLETLRDRNQLRPIDPQVAAVLLFAMLQYYSATYPASAALLGEASPELTFSLKETIVTIFLDGVLADDSVPVPDTAHGKS